MMNIADPSGDVREFSRSAEAHSSDWRCSARHTGFDGRRGLRPCVSSCGGKAPCSRRLVTLTRRLGLSAVSVSSAASAASTTTTMTTMTTLARSAAASGGVGGGVVGVVAATGQVADLLAWLERHLGLVGVVEGAVAAARGGVGDRACSARGRRALRGGARSGRRVAGRGFLLRGLLAGIARGRPAALAVLYREALCSSAGLSRGLRIRSGSVSGWVSCRCRSRSSLRPGRARR
jgi:hypothetical protein